MECPKSERSNGGGRPTSLGESVQERSVVVVAVDANRDLMLAALQYTLMHLIKTGDNLYLLGILRRRAVKAGSNEVNTICKEIHQKKAEFQKAIASDQEIQKLFDLNKITPSVYIAAGPDRKVVTAMQAVELRATWVILDKHLKEDKDYLMEHLNCNIIVMKGKNKEARIIKIALRHAENPKGLVEWNARWKSAVGTARALRYLQEECHVRCLVHRDMRPTNILLTNESDPMGENFGPSSKSQINGVKEQEPKAIGKLSNYIAPEYGEGGGSIPEKADVYSFGILLLELITGRKANDITKMSLTDWARQLIHTGKTLELVDPRLRDVCNVDQVMRMVDAAGRCISKDPARRPEMSEVLDILERDTKNVRLTRGKAAKDVYNSPRHPTSKRSQISPFAPVGNVDSLQLSRTRSRSAPLMGGFDSNGDGASAKIKKHEHHRRNLKTLEEVLGQEVKASSSSSPSSSSPSQYPDKGKFSFFTTPTPGRRLSYNPTPGRRLSYNNPTSGRRFSYNNMLAAPSPTMKLSYNDMVSAPTPKKKISYNEMIADI